MSHDRGCPCGKEKWDYDACYAARGEACHKSLLVREWNAQRGLIRQGSPRLTEPPLVTAPSGWRSPLGGTTEVQAVEQEVTNMGKSELVDLTVQKHAETTKAILVSDTGEEKDAVWLPLSQVEVEPGDKPGVVIVTCPEWLAMGKGLI